jgi:hypothetical protein
MPGRRGLDAASRTGAFPPTRGKDHHCAVTPACLMMADHLVSSLAMSVVSN